MKPDTRPPIYQTKVSNDTFVSVRDSRSPLGAVHRRLRAKVSRSDTKV
jgi:hypothetical protein